MMTTGMSKISREREFAIWDSRSLSAPVSCSHIGGTSSGFLLPNLQYGLGLITLCGRGDSTVRQALRRQREAPSEKAFMVHFCQLLVVTDFGGEIDMH